MAYKINEDLYIGNTNTQLKDLLVSNGDTLPIGSIIPYGSSTAPSNWLKCDGRAVSRTTYSELFSVIGTLYGSGDGSTTFNLPNLKGKVTIGQDTTDSDFNTIGKTGGEKTHTLTIKEMPKHAHEMRVVKDNETNSGGNLPKGNNSQGNNNGWSDYINDITNYAINNKGGGQAHNNMPPYIVTNYIIKANHTSYVGEESVVQTSYSTSTTDTYSCNYINNLNNYSTDEIKIGRWYDGKPIYRKCINTTKNQVSTIMTSLNIKRLISTVGSYATSIYNNSWPIPSYYTEELEYNIGLMGGNTPGENVSITFGSFYNDNSPVLLILEYTKTTD